MIAKDALDQIVTGTMLPPDIEVQALSGAAL
jgi:hypothetical protein